MRILFRALIILAFGCSGLSWAQTNLPLSDVKPGLEGYALTAGAGNVRIFRIFCFGRLAILLPVRAVLRLA
jgi:hypothetical protein